LILAATLLGESVRPIQLAGGALILAAVVILSRSTAGKRDAVPEQSAAA
jgi:drug/metabolite transporter (DMT)-like permease